MSNQSVQICQIHEADEPGESVCAFPVQPLNDTDAREAGDWKLLVIDDDESVHQVTRMVLERVRFEGRGLCILDGYCAEQARRLLREHPDIAAVLLDVVMETPDSGLEIVRFIREELGNRAVRIILRTGQPGAAPECEVMSHYDINDYKEKSELTARRLNTAVVSALRGYRDLQAAGIQALSARELEAQVRSRTLEIMKINQDLEDEIRRRAEVNRDLQETTSHLGHAQQIAKIGSWEWNMQSDKVIWSDQVYRILGLEPHSFPASFSALVNAVADEDRVAVSAAYARTLEHGEPLDIEHAMLCTRDEVVYVHQQAHLEYDGQGRPYRLAGTIQDVSERSKAEAKMRKLSGAIAQIADSVMITNESGIIEYVNTAFEKMTGYSHSEVVGRSASILKTDRQSDAFYQRLWRTITRGEVFNDVMANRKKNGDIYYEEKTITPQVGQAGTITHYISTGRDITERVAAQDKVQYLVHHDTLTGLPNRVLLQDRLEQAITRTRWRGREVAVVALDIDRFNLVNDSLGHDMGDQLLRALALRLSDSVREGDTVSRMGSDEFAVIFNDLACDADVPAVIDKVRQVVAEPFYLEGHELFVTACMGVSRFAHDGQDAAALLKQADAAMCKAKSEGHNSCRYYTAEVDTGAKSRLSLDTGLRRALERQEFYLEYQPKYSLSDDRLDGAEALLRWRNARFDAVSPVHFIPLLEETGMIVPVGEWALRNACVQGKVWQEAGLPPKRIAVNLSMRQFRCKTLVKDIERILQETGFDASLLELEVTEGVLMDCIAQTSHMFHELHELGVHLAVDDFGTGYASLNYLKRLPFDTLKIDRSFVGDVTASADDAAIASAIIELGHVMDMRVVAEGVETVGQQSFLQEQCCDLAQGYLYSPPVSAQSMYRVFEMGRALPVAASER